MVGSPYWMAPEMLSGNASLHSFLYFFVEENLTALISLT